MQALPVYEIDGRNLYHSFVAGAKKILENQHYLNKINVFPVSDGDTGSNMAVTIRSAIESIRPDKSFKITAGRIAESAMENARGNSGIIFAQFLYGMSKEAGDYHRLNIPQFAASLKQSVHYMYEAIANPVEGTMLTVIKDWSKFIYDRRNIVTDFKHLLTSSTDTIAKSLAETKQKLLVLAKANVVDAGAHAFVLFIEGIIEFIDTYSLRKLLQSRTEFIVLPANNEQVPEEVKFRYCTEGIVRNLTTDQKTLMRILKKHGDSVVIGGNDMVKHIHVHTNHPAKLFHQLKDIGLITFQKADDMLRQSDTIHNRKWKTALVTDSTCDLPQELIDHYQINMLPLNINFGESHYLDKITIQPQQFYTLLRHHDEFPKTSQVNEKAFSNLYAQLAAHYDSIIAIHLTDKFSGTYYSSVKAALTASKEFNKPITVLNSKNLSGALGLITLRTAQAIDAGLKHEEIVSMMEKWIADSRIFVSVKTLKYMVRGGRVSYMRGFIAGLLNINPIVSMDENGNSFVFGKTFSQKSNMKKVMKHIQHICKDRVIWNYIVLHAQNTDAAEWYTQKMKDFTGKMPVAVVNISPVIGANAGIGTASVALMFN
ncbi:MAG: DegV family EDD domain-containing protein [Bacteroidales bacterium]|nr:DegV family EDD domain-containing protein [Bacteroidales bacterium]